MPYNNTLLEFTRFYKGPGTEPINQENNAQLLWEYERKWVENEEDGAEDHPRVLEYHEMCFLYIMKTTEFHFH